MKGDYLHHFSLPRLDLLAWVLIKKLAPTFYQKLDVMLIDVGRFRELPKWRKDFKADWKKAMETLITMPINDAWRPNAKRFVCTCPRFVVSRFLLCKHVVQLFHPVNPRFFLEVTRNRTLPFWSHHSLKPLIEDTDATEEDLDHPLATGGDGDDNAWSWLNMAGQNFEDESDDGRNDNEGEGNEGEGNEGEGDDGLVDTEERWANADKKTYKEKMENYIRIIRDFCDGLEYQVNFQDPRFLTTLEKDGAGFLRLTQNCLSRERRLNSSRAASPSTWEKSTANAMFYRARPTRDHAT